MAKAKLNLKGLTDREIIALGNTIQTALTDNPNFPAPVPSLAALAAGLANGQAKILECELARQTAMTKTAEQKAAMAELERLLSQCAAYVDSFSGGDAAKIASAGMAVRASNTVPVGVLGQVLELAVTESDYEGSLEARWKLLRGASCYEVQTSPEPVSPTSWSMRQSSSKSRCRLNGFTSGARIWVRVRGIGARGPGPWSDPAVKTVP